MKMNHWIEMIVGEIQKLEELGGPELSEYVMILEAVRFDVDERIRVAKGRIEAGEKQ